MTTTSTDTGPYHSSQSTGLVDFCSCRSSSHRSPNCSTDKKSQSPPILTEDAHIYPPIQIISKLQSTQGQCCSQVLNGKRRREDPDGVAEAHLFSRSCPRPIQVWFYSTYIRLEPWIPAFFRVLVKSAFSAPQKRSHLIHPLLPLPRNRSNSLGQRLPLAIHFGNFYIIPSSRTKLNSITSSGSDIDFWKTHYF